MLVMQVVYLGDTGKLFTTGFSKFSDREYAVWSENDLSSPLKMESIDSSSGDASFYCKCA
jgi:coronin-2